MQYVPLGQTGLQVSELCFGTMSFGGDADEKTSVEMFNRCRDVGINFFDCANVYNYGQAEEILGRLIADCREEVVITTKCFMPKGDDINSRGGSRRHIMYALEASLKRLGTDRVDVFFLHKFDERTPIEESLRSLDDMVRQGKILYPAASNYAAWQVAKALGISAREGLAPFCCLQPMYSLVKRQAEVELLPLAEAEGLGVTPYSPIAGGLLSGKYVGGKKPDVGRFLVNTMYQNRYGEDHYSAIAEAYTEFAHERGLHPVSLAVAWVGSHSGVTAPIIGARNVDQLEDSLRSMEIDMSPELRQEVAALSPTPPPATDRSEETKG